MVEHLPPRSQQNPLPILISAVLLCQPVSNTPPVNKSLPSFVTSLRFIVFVERQRPELCAVTLWVLVDPLTLVPSPGRQTDPKLTLIQHLVSLDKS